jgi:hypothetical protein
MLSEQLEILENARASGQALVLVIGASRDNPSDVERWDRICSETFGGVWFGLSGPYIFNPEYGPQFPVETMRPFYDTFGENWETWEFEKMKDALGWPDIRFDHVISDYGVLQYWKKIKVPQRNKLCLYWGHPDTIYYVGPVGKPEDMMKMWKFQKKTRKTYDSYTSNSVYSFSSLIKQTGDTIEINLYLPDSDDISTSTYLVCALQDRIKKHKLFKGIGSSGFILRM